MGSILDEIRSAYAEEIDWHSRLAATTCRAGHGNELSHAKGSLQVPRMKRERVMVKLQEARKDFLECLPKTYSHVRTVANLQTSSRKSVYICFRMAYCVSSEVKR